MSRSTYGISFFLRLLILSIILQSCYSGPTEERTTVFDQYYVFELDTLLSSLQNANTNTFLPVNKRPGFVPIDQQLPVPWHQADYFNITTGLYNNTLRKSLQGWQLHNMDFASSCNNIEEGFQNGRFEFFNVINEKENESRMSRFIDIDTRGKFVHIKESEYYPKVVDWAVIDLEKLNISADQAFEIAEKNGGKEKRQSVNNKCEVALILAPDNASYRGWSVIYTQDDGTFLFRIQIDPYTGKLHFP